MSLVCSSLIIGMIGFLVCSMFSGGLNLKIFWMIAGLTVAIRSYAYKESTQ